MELRTVLLTCFVSIPLGVGCGEAANTGPERDREDAGSDAGVGDGAVQDAGLPVQDGGDTGDAGPRWRDFDRDGINDADETLMRFDLGSTVLVLNPFDDPDGDGIESWRDASVHDPARSAICYDDDANGFCDKLSRAFDVDGDGTPNFADSDADGDGLLDFVEGTGDDDDDGIPNFLDPSDVATDADADGIPDESEASLVWFTEDLDQDGVPSWYDANEFGFEPFICPDADGDGLCDRLSLFYDMDQDGRPNHLDTDSDGDGRLDATEGLADRNRDGLFDFLDPAR